MEPLTALLISGGIQGVAALAAMYQGMKAQEANQAELNRIKDMWDKVVPPDYNMDITTPPEIISSFPPPPNLDFSSITPEDYKVVSQYAPAITPYIQEKFPELIEMGAEGKEGKTAMLDALREYQRIGKQENDPALMAQMRRAQNDAMASSQSRAKGIEQDFARRGNLGSTNQLASQIAAGEGQINRQADLESQALAEAYRNRLEAMRQSAGIGEAVSNQDFSQKQANANIINNYNQRFSTQAQNQANLSNQIQNEGQRFNIGQNQLASDKNVAGRNAADIRNQDRRTELAKDMYGMQTSRIKDSNVVAQGDYENKIAREQYLNTLKDKKFGNQVGIISGQQGLGQTQMGLNTSMAAGKQNIISSLGNAAGNAVTSYPDLVKENEAYKRREKIRKDEEEQNELLKG